MKKPQKNALEWLVFAGSVVLIVAVVATLLVEATTSGDEPPLLRIETGSATKSGEVFRVPLRVRNDGDDTAELAQIEVSLMDGDREVERAEVSFAFVPRKSTEQGWVAFRRDPRCCKVVTRAVAFTKP